MMPHRALTGMWLERLSLDIRYAIRLWAGTPGFSLVAVLTIAVGIGASTAIVSQIDAVFRRPLPVSRPGDLRFIAWTSPRPHFVAGPNALIGSRIGNTQTFAGMSYPAYTALRDGSRMFSNVACWSDISEARPVVIGESGFGAIHFVSGNYFETLGVRAANGRTLTPRDDELGVLPTVAMISHPFWARAFGRDPKVTERTLLLNGRSFAIVGVTPEGFFGLDPATTPDVLLPMSAVPIAAATANALARPDFWTVCRVVGRLSAGATEEAARQESEDLIADAIARQPPTQPYDPPRIWLIDGSRGLTTLRDATAAPLLVLFIVITGLLLAACANIAGLLLARGNARQKEIATRLALGAPRGRVIRQLMTESLVLSCAGGVLGLGVAYVLAGVAPWLLSQFMPLANGADRIVSVSVPLDARVFALSLATAVVAGLLFGAMPALRASRVSLITSIRQSPAAGTGRGGFTTGHAMVAAQTALAMLLLVGAGLFLRTLANLRENDVGFATDGLLYARLEPRSGGIPPTGRRQFFENAVKRIESLPGVVSASASSSPPMGTSASTGLRADAWRLCEPNEARSTAHVVDMNWVAPRFFATLGVAFIAGRDMTWRDSFEAAGDTPRAIINEAFARQHIGRAEVLGQIVRVGAPCEQFQVPVEVIGLVADNRTQSRFAAPPAMYWPLGGFGGPVTLTVRTSLSPSQLVPTIRRAVGELHANVSTFGETTVAELRERQLRQERLLSVLLLGFGTITLLVSCLGIYGLLSYAVARRRSEISVRMAIGAGVPHVVRMIVADSVVPVAAGAVAGVLGAVALARSAESLLFGVSSLDPLAVAGAAMALLVLAAVAAAIPARAAARIDPVLALRQ
jgi:predicted permease